MKPASRANHRAHKDANSPRPKVGISACILGHNVRYDGGHKRSRVVAEVLARRFEFVPLCREVELGLGVPREPISLIRRGREIRLVGNQSGHDHTAAMRAWAKRRLETLARENLSGYILRSASPSCGLAGVKILSSSDAIDKNGRGLFAQALVRRYPELPVVEDNSLADAGIRRKFIERVIAYSCRRKNNR